jgi:hypothetical protein
LKKMLWLLPLFFLFGICASAQTVHTYCPLDGTCNWLGVNNFNNNLNVVNAGIFNAGTYTCYLCSAVGGWTPSSILPGPITLPSELDVISAGLVIPAGSNVNAGAESIGAYAINQADTRPAVGACPPDCSGAKNNAVDVFGICKATASNSSCWGENYTVGDYPGTSGSFLIGSEIDMYPLGNGRILAGFQLTINGGTGILAGGSAGFVINNNRTDGQTLSIGYFANPTCCLVAFEAGSLAGANTGSQSIVFGRNVSSVYTADANIAEDASGNLNLTVPANAGVNVAGILSLTGTSNTIDFSATAHKTIFFVPDPVATRSINLPDSGVANTNVGLSLNLSTGTYASGTVAGCTTGSAQGNTCLTGSGATGSVVTVSLPASFLDTAYDAGCSPRGAPTNFPGTPFVVTKSVGSFTVNYIAETAASASWPNLDCWAIHH